MTEASETPLYNVLQSATLVGMLEPNRDFVKIPFTIVTESTPRDTTAKAQSKKSKPSTKDRVKPILSSCICLDLCQSAIFQCTNGHLMCVSCLHHLLADCKLKQQDATCPNCRCDVSRMNCTRNLAVEKMLL